MPRVLTYLTEFFPDAATAWGSPAVLKML
ncbi:hypothetical protein KL86PLE_40470 [uncultured Pleomorphomonas sp.]|uniref:Uncharacterized protein n=1 Tax=uncultured Pleomorphomonas sp. TaxID=442121 RepID=A0A212LGJ3_9HYPH|nr:hypothetical protein KL86PLE_40470 [uncultured Pleomorphomonas sp.]